MARALQAEERRAIGAQHRYRLMVRHERERKERRLGIERVRYDYEVGQRRRTHCLCQLSCLTSVLHAPLPACLTRGCLGPCRVLSV